MAHYTFLYLGSLNDCIRYRIPSVTFAGWNINYFVEFKGVMRLRNGRRTLILNAKVISIWN